MRGFLYFGLREYGRFFPADKEAFLPLGLFYLIKENFARGLLRLSLFGLIFI